MATAQAFARGAEIEASLELFAERCADPTPEVYRRLFAAQPEMKPHFRRDTNDAVKGEMLARTFETILDFVGERRFAHNMIGAERSVHEGYDVPREVFVSFFAVLRDTMREEMAADWTAAFETAWAEMLIEMEAYA
jgi:hemoglobin-like flavoprotein